MSGSEQQGNFADALMRYQNTILDTPFGIVVENMGYVALGIFILLLIVSMRQMKKGNRSAKVPAVIAGVWIGCYGFLSILVSPTFVNDFMKEMFVYQPEQQIPDGPTGYQVVMDRQLCMNFLQTLEPAYDGDTVMVHDVQMVPQKADYPAGARAVVNDLAVTEDGKSGIYCNSAENVVFWQ